MLHYAMVVTGGVGWLVGSVVVEWRGGVEWWVGERERETVGGRESGD